MQKKQLFNYIEKPSVTDHNWSIIVGHHLEYNVVRSSGEPLSGTLGETFFCIYCSIFHGGTDIGLVLIS